ncbi:MAG: hypothetical protein OEZ06_11310 [Myxococcales bacterium]|nr:hypothetical protein [Myxococcales bacterium]
MSDADNDGISDLHEGVDDEVNTDGDEWPDWLDLDSDGDGLSDRDEAGDDDLSTPPIDTDMDGKPDFRDLDSDDDGVPDSESADAQGVAVDSDGDGVPDSADRDDDGDGIPDRVEALGGGGDADGDGIPNWLDRDTDGDGIDDVIEGTTDSDGDGLPDFLDLDSDDDGLADADEDRDGDGKVAVCTDPTAGGCESDRTRSDTDGDGVPDLVEAVASTDPTDATSTISARDFYFVLPYEDPEQDGVLDFSTTIRQADVFFSVDTTGSFGEEIAAIQSSIESLIVPEVAAVIENAAFGVGRFEDYPSDPYGLPGDRPFELLQAVTTDVAMIKAGVDALPPAAGGLDTPEAGLEALYQWATGVGSPELGIAPFAPGDIGGAGFREDSLPILVQITDARSHDPMDYSAASIVSRDAASTAEALRLIGARAIGVRSTENVGNADDPLAELQQLALATGATIPPTGGECATGIDGAPRAAVDDGGRQVCPLVFDVRPDGTGLGQIIVDAIEQLASLGALDISAVAVGVLTGVGGESLPAGTTSADFIQAIHAEPPAPDGSTLDGDTFRHVVPGSTVNFRLVARNDFVPHREKPQVFTLEIHVLGDGVTVLDVRTVYIVVPKVLPTLVVE